MWYVFNGNWMIFPELGAETHSLDTVFFQETVNCRCLPKEQRHGKHLKRNSRKTNRS